MELAIEITKSESASNVVWQKDGQSVEKSLMKGIKRLSQGSKHILVIDNATVHHEGEYIASVGEQECSCELTVVGREEQNKITFMNLQYVQ